MLLAVWAPDVVALGGLASGVDQTRELVSCSSLAASDMYRLMHGVSVPCRIEAQCGEEPRIGAFSAIGFGAEPAAAILHAEHFHCAEHVIDD